MKKNLNTEFEELFTPKWGIQILNPQKKSLDFLNFSDFLKFFLVYEDFIIKKRFKHWIREVVHS